MATGSTGVGVGFGGGGISLGSLVAHITVDMSGLTTGLSRAMDKFKDFTTQTDSFMKKHGAGLRHLSLSAGLAGTAIAVGITKAVGSYVSFEGAMRRATAVSDVTTSQFKDMSAMAERVSTDLNMSATMTAEGFFHLGQAGLTAAQQMEAFVPVAMMARAGFIDMESAAQMTVNTIQSFKLEWSDTQRVADVMSQAVIKSTLEFSDLREALKYVGTNAQSTNNSLEDTIAMIALMANVGIRGTVAGTSLRRALTNLQAPTSDVRKALRDYNIEVYDGTGKMKPFVQLVEEINEALRGASEEQRNHAFSAIFGIRAISGQLAIFNKSKAEIDEMRDAMFNANGVMKTITDKQMVAMGQRIGQLMQSIEQFKRKISEGLAPALLDFTKDGKDAISALNDWISAHKAGAAAMTASIGVISYLTSGISATGFALAGLAAAAKAFKIAFSGLLLSLGGITAGLAILTAGIVYSIIQHKLLKQEHAELKAEINEVTDALKKEIEQWDEYKKTLDSNITGKRIVDVHDEMIKRKKLALEALKAVAEETNPDKSWLSRNLPFTSSMVDEYKTSSDKIKNLMKEAGLTVTSWNTENIASLKIWAETAIKTQDKVAANVESTAKRIIKAIEEANKGPIKAVGVWEALHRATKAYYEDFDKNYPKIGTETGAAIGITSYFITKWQGVMGSIKDTVASTMADIADGTQSITEGLESFTIAIRRQLLEMATDVVATQMMRGFWGMAGMDTSWNDPNLVATEGNTIATNANTVALNANTAALGGAATASTISSGGGSFLSSLGAMMAGPSGTPTVDAVAAGPANDWMMAGFSKGGIVYAANGFMPKGTDTVPAMLTPGERVFSVEDNKSLIKAVQRPQRSQTNVMHIQVSAIDAQGTYQFLNNNKRAIASMIQNAQRNNHPSRRGG